MRILFTVHQFEKPSAGGTEVYTHTLAEELSKRHEVGVLYPSAQPGGSPLTEGRVGEVRHFVMRAAAPEDPFVENYEGARFRASIEDTLERFRPDVVHVQHLSGLGTSLLEAAREGAARTVMTIADYWPFCPRGQMIRDDLENCVHPEEARCAACLFVGPGIKNLEQRARQLTPFLERLADREGESSLRKHGRLAIAGLLSKIAGSLPEIEQARTAVRRRLDRLQMALHAIDLFIAPSESIRQRYALLGVPLVKIKHLDYGFAPLAQVDRPARRGGPLRLGFLGTLIPSKGPHLLGQALALLPKGLAEAHFWGEAVPYHGDESYGRDLERALGESCRVRGSVSHGEIAEVLSEIDALVVPSMWQENSPLVIHEALQAGVPVIAARVGGIPELVREGETGLLFDSGSAADLAAKIELFAAGAVDLSKRNRWKLAVDPIGEHARRLEEIYLEGTLA